jgi:hypothetical protein
MPSSLYFKDLDISTEPKVKVKYFCKATFRCKDSIRDMSHKQVLVIRQPPVLSEDDCVINFTQEVNIMNCCARGYSVLSCEFEKNIFTPVETAEGIIRIDNSNCQLPIKTIRL